MYRNTDRNKNGIETLKKRWKHRQEKKIKNDPKIKNGERHKKENEKMYKNNRFIKEPENYTMALISLNVFWYFLRWSVSRSIVVCDRVDKNPMEFVAPSHVRLKRSLQRHIIIIIVAE